GLLAARDLHPAAHPEPWHRPVLLQPRPRVRLTGMGPDPRLHPGGHVGTDVAKRMDYVIGGWQINTNAWVYSGQHLNVDYRDNGQDRDTGPNRPNVIGDINEGGGSQDRWFNATPLGYTGSAFA